jgi:proline racemase
VSGDPVALGFVDSHTAGEPTRVIVDGWPRPAGATMQERRESLRRDADHLRRAVVCEPRGHAAIVGALLTPAVNPDSAAGIVFFNNETYLGMCGHGLIGVVRTLAHLGRLGPGTSRFDTPVGTVAAELHDDGSVSFANVPAFCERRDVRLDVPGYGMVTGDIAFGGNWFFITHLANEPIGLDRVEPLTRATRAIQRALDDAGLRRMGQGATTAGDVDHIEISGPPSRADADARNFVLCSGGEYDRSPCGTGTCAVMAARHARGELALEQRWHQESVTGSMFTGWLTRRDDGALIPHIQGSAFITGEGTLHLDAADPFRFGFQTA